MTRTDTWTLGTSVSQNKTHIYDIHNNLTHPNWNGEKALQLLDTILKTSGIPRWVQLHEVCSGKALFCCALYQRHRPIFQKIQIWATFVTFKPLKNFTVKQLSLPRFLYYRWCQITHHSAERLRFWIQVLGSSFKMNIQILNVSLSSISIISVDQKI